MRYAGLLDNSKLNTLLDNGHIVPQKGPQRAFYDSIADLTFFGGSAGGGKTHAILQDFTRYMDIPRARGVAFRRTTPEITVGGGMWEASRELYLRPEINAEPKESRLTWIFPSGARIKFSHLEHEKDVYSWQGSELAIIYLDELTHFTYRQFWYLLSRNRSTSGIRPCIKATMNPDPQSWVAGFISWWINPDTGYVIPERAGKLRYMYRLNDRPVWGDTPEALKKAYPYLAESEPLSVTFIPSRLEDNQILMAKDPGYKSRLFAMSKVDRERLYSGNWKIREGSGNYFQSKWFPIIKREQLPKGLLKIRFWDLAGTGPKEDKEAKENYDGEQACTASVLLSLDARTGMFYMEHITNDMLEVRDVEEKMMKIVGLDGPQVTVGVPQDPGQAGKAQILYLRQKFSGYHFYSIIETGSKEGRAKPVSARAENGQITVVEGHWNEEFFTQAENFPKGRKDIIDALSGAITYYIEQRLVAMSDFISKAAPVDKQSEEERLLEEGKYTKGVAIEEEQGSASHSKW